MCAADVGCSVATTFGPFDACLVTARLRGLPLSESDFDDLYALHRDQRVLAAFGAEPSTAEETRAFLARKLAHWREHGFGIWMFRDSDGTFVGRCGIHRWALDSAAPESSGLLTRTEHLTHT